MLVFINPNKVHKDAILQIITYASNRSEIENLRFAGEKALPVPIHTMQRSCSKGHLGSIKNKINRLVSVHEVNSWRPESSVPVGYNGKRRRDGSLVVAVSRRLL